MTPDEWLLAQFDERCRWGVSSRGNIPRYMIQIIDDDPGRAYDWRAGDPDPHDVIT